MSYVSWTAVWNQLNAMTGFAVRTFIMKGDFTDDASVPLPKRLDVVIAAMVATCRGASQWTPCSPLSPCSTRFCIGGGQRSAAIATKCRGKVHDPANYDRMADLADPNLGRWVGN